MEPKYVVMGQPVSHSLTPQLIDYVLTNFRLEGTAGFLDTSEKSSEAMRRSLSDVSCASVTMPMKEAAFAFCDEVSETARRIRSVNSIKRSGDQWQGISSDGEGFVAALRAERGVNLSDLHVAILGTGGSARAIIDASVANGARVSVFGRNFVEGDAVATVYPDVSFNDLSRGTIDLVVNTIPSSAGSDRIFVKLEPELNSHTLGFDVTYEPRETEWMKYLGNRFGALSTNGLAMLVHQAKIQFDWWFGIDVDVNELMEVAR